MAYVFLYVLNITAYNMVIGPAGVGAGSVRIALGPDPLAPAGVAGGALRSDGNGDLNITYTPSIANPIVDLGIQVTLDAGTNFHVTVDSSRTNVAEIDYVWAPLVIHGIAVYDVVVLVS